MTSFGNTNSNFNSLPFGKASQSLQINNPAPYTTIEARVTVTQAAVQDCVSNPFTGIAFAGIFASFFNDGNGGPGNQTGDVRARLAKRRDSAGVNTIQAVVLRCDNADCDNPSVVGDPHVFTTGWALKKADTLTLEWDKAGAQFIFTVNGVDSTTISYEDVTINTPAAEFRQLEVRNRPENCVAGQTSASMTARFDNVMVNIIP